MNLDKVIKAAHKLSRRYRVTNGKKFRLADIDPGDTGGLRDEAKGQAKADLQTGVEALAKLQDILFAQDRWALLLIFQAMDAAGKDGAIKHVMSGVNPQGCDVSSFKVPSAEELDHDFLWRCTRRLPERGHIGIFNRSYYEETLVVRVHQDLLRAEKLAPKLLGKDVWERRFRDIRAFERYLDDNGTVTRKFFLHISFAEQKRRFLDRIDDPDKNWKFSSADVKERGRWKEYMAAYEDMIRNTATPEAPWYVIPADNKWFTRMVVSAAVIDALGSLGLEYPRVDKTKQRELADAERALLAEK